VVAGVGIGVGVQCVCETVRWCVEEGKDVPKYFGVFEGHCCALACLDGGEVISFEAREGHQSPHLRLVP